MTLFFFSKTPHLVTLVATGIHCFKVTPSTNTWDNVILSIHKVISVLLRNIIKRVDNYMWLNSLGSSSFLSKSNRYDISLKCHFSKLWKQDEFMIKINMCTVFYCSIPLKWYVIHASKCRITQIIGQCLQKHALSLRHKEHYYFAKIQ